MEKLKVKVIGVLRERDDTTNLNRKQKNNNHHNSSSSNNLSNIINVNGGQGSLTTTAAVAVANGTGSGDTSGAVATTGTGTLNILNETSVSGGGGGDIVIGGAITNSNIDVVGSSARTSTILVSSPKLNAMDLNAILNSRRRLEWTREWLKKNQSEFLSKENLRSEINFRNNETYHLNCFFTISERQFQYLVNKLKSEISQFEPHRKKKSFSAEERIAITLKYLATGEVNSCRNYCFRASKPVIIKMIANICLSFYTLLKDQFLQLPKTDDEWQQCVISELQRKHRLPNCLGNMFMRKIEFHSTMRIDEQKDAPLVLTGIVDGKRNFLYVNVEQSRAKSAHDIYEKSTLREVIEKKALPLPTTMDVIDGCTNNSTAYSYFVGDATLPSKVYLLTTQNLRANTQQQHDRVKMLEQLNLHAEHTLRILCNIFPILAQPMRVDATHARKIALGCLALYNFLRKSDNNYRQRTDNLIRQPMEVDEDEDCIMIGSEEELRERAEFTPTVSVSTCLRALTVQNGETPAGLLKRERIMQQLPLQQLPTN